MPPPVAEPLNRWPERIRDGEHILRALIKTKHEKALNQKCEFCGKKISKTAMVDREKEGSGEISNIKNANHRQMIFKCTSGNH